MTTLDNSISWAVLAPLPVTQLEQIAIRRWHDEFPSAVKGSPWEAVAGSRDYAALFFCEPGGEGSDRPFAEEFSRLAPDAVVFSIWFNPEMPQIFRWQNGREDGTQAGDPLDFAESLGFNVQRPPLPMLQYSVAVVEGASVADVRNALGASASEPWLHIVPGELGTLVSATDGEIAMQAWDIAERLLDATVYLVQRWPEPDWFSVSVIRGAENIGAFRVPDFGEANLADIKGQRNPASILKALGVSPGLLQME
jgi:hypothetical protein